MSLQNPFHDPHHAQDWHKSPTFLSGHSSTKAAYAVLTFILIYYILQYLNPIHLSLSESLWNFVVWIAPSRIIARMDSAFEIAMLEEERFETGFDSKAYASKSDAMRRIVGLDGTGIMTNLQRTKTVSNMGRVFQKKPKFKLPGLGNWDNSCYQNSVLQALAALKSLPAFLHQNLQSDLSQPTMSALGEIVARLNHPANMGRTFWTPEELRSMSSLQQQDAQEYFSKISDGLEKDAFKDVIRKLNLDGLEKLSSQAMDVTSSTPSETDSVSAVNACITNETTFPSRTSQLPEELASIIVRNPLEGLLAQRVGCQKCGFVEGLSLVPFNCLTVPLGRNWLYDIRSCLDGYTALEPIDGVECAKCTLLRDKQSLEKVLQSLRSRNRYEDQTPSEFSNDAQKYMEEHLKILDKAVEDGDYSDQTLKRCQIPPKNRVSTTKSRQAVIARVPKSLVIHVNRSRFNEVTGVQSKNPAHVTFPRHLDLAPWCLGQNPELYDKETTTEGWNTDPSKSMLHSANSRDLDSDQGFELRAVITHHGHHDNGHYICYRKSPYPIPNRDTNIGGNHESWWCLNDQDVTKVTEEHVLAQIGVFMLFYEQPAAIVPPQGENISIQQANEEEVAKTSVEAPMELSPVIEEPPSSDAVPVTHNVTFAETTLPTPPPTPLRSQQVTETSTPTDSTAEVSKTGSVDAVNEPSSETATPGLPMGQSMSAEPLRDHSQAEVPPPHFPSQPPQQNQPVSPVAMRTASPRNRRGSVSRAGKAMGSVAGFVQAN